MNESGKNAGYLAFGLLGFWFWADVSVWWIVGGLVLIAIVIMLLVYFEHHNRESKLAKAYARQITPKPRLHEQTQKEQPKPQGERNYHAWPDVLQDGVEGVEYCIARGDWPLARSSVQQLAYTVGASSEQNQKDFHAYYCNFYKRDPLYQGVLKKLLELVNAEHGIVQSTIYKHFTGMDAETMRLHLYVAEQIGDIRRIKKGNSYKLYPVDIVLDQ